MRLGDLDALKEDLFIKFGNQLPNGLLDEIENAQTVSEIPQGEWIKDNQGDRFCSECGSCALYHEIGTKFESRFCPNCGAKMTKR